MKRSLILPSMTSPVIAIIVCALTGSLLFGCAAEEPADLGVAIGDTASGDSALIEALPTASSLGVVLPNGSADSDGYGTQEGALVGETSELWAHTAKTAWAMNSGLAHVLIPIKFITTNIKPAYQGKHKAVWFGSTPLDPQQHLLVVRKVKSHHRFIVLARLKTQADDPKAWRVRVVGRRFSGPNGGAFGRVWVDMDTDLNPETTGKVLAAWAKGPAGREITGFFFKFSDGTHPPLSQVAHYSNESDLSGVLVHAVRGIDLNKGEAGMEAKENAVLISRWDASGDGRGDLLAMGGDIKKQGLQVAAFTQCWTAPSFASSYEALHGKKKLSPPFLVEEDGDKSTCAFPKVGDAELPDLGAEPAVEADDIPEEVDL